MMIAISKITRAGQVTLPKKMRDTGAFARATAVAFEQRDKEVVITPLRTARTATEHSLVLDHTMRDWLRKEHDDLFDLSE